MSFTVAYKSYSQGTEPTYVVPGSVDQASIQIYKDGAKLIPGDNPGEGGFYIIPETGVISYSVAWAGESIEILEYSLDEINEKLDMLLTEATGSWIWDKASGTLIMSDPQGVQTFAFQVSDDATSAVRERRADLEAEF